MGLFALALASTVLATPSKPPARATVATRAAPLHVVVLVLDGARYQEIFSGSDPSRGPALSAEALMPELHRIGEHDGALLGAPGYGMISASGPDFVSLPGYSEILTGRKVSGCANNACRGTSALSLLDELALAGVSSAVATSWPDIERVAATRPEVAISTGRHAGANRGAFANVGERSLERAEPEAPWPGYGDFRRDRFTGRLALDYFEERLPSLLFVSLGEPDEFAHQGNYAGYLDALREADLRIGAFQQALARRAARGERTALFVTADHGRADNFRDHGQNHPESARVWLLASGTEIHARGRAESPVDRRLADIAPTVRRLFGLPVDRGPSAGTALTELLAEAHK